MKDKHKLLLYIWAMGMFGVLVVNLFVVPGLIKDQELPFSIELAILLSTIQSSLLVLLASWGGSKLADRLGLKAPALQAYISGQSVKLAILKEFTPGMVGGLVGALLLIFAHIMLPQQLNQPESLQTFPLLVKILYGGITEEILLRWGVMSFLAWGMWWVFQKQEGFPKTSIIVISIVASAILFALGHLPAATLIAGESLTITSIIYVITFNSVFGLIAGFLFWRYGLESAIIAHIVTHLFSHYFVI